jgi:uncharacterized membrane protein YeaQ/YmgE (transglycosylase-associated protein family)
MTVDSMPGLILIGALAGWLAGLLVRGKGHGIVLNIVVGIVGAIIGSQIYRFLGLATDSTIGDLFMAVVGAAVLLGLLQLIRRG